MPTKPVVSIVIPVYHNAESLRPLHERLEGVAVRMPHYTFEFLFVDDGSKDNSLDVLKILQQKDERIRIVKLTRNFGSPMAILAGLENSRGDLIGVLTADLQDPPEHFEKMIPLIETGKKLVLGVREGREDKSFFSNLFYWIMRRFAYKHFPAEGFDMILARREVVKKVCAMKEKNAPPMTLMLWAGYDYASIGYLRKKRPFGKSQFNLEKKLKFFVDSFASFSYFPIRLMTALGVIVSCVSLLYGIFVVINGLFGNIQVFGWASLISMMTFFMGMVMLMLGIMGEYLWRALDESRGRDPYVVDEIY